MSEFARQLRPDHAPIEITDDDIQGFLSLVPDQQTPPLPEPYRKAYEERDQVNQELAEAFGEGRTLEIDRKEDEDADRKAQQAIDAIFQEGRKNELIRELRLSLGHIVALEDIGVHVPLRRKQSLDQLVELSKNPDRMNAMSTTDIELLMIEVTRISVEMDSAKEAYKNKSELKLRQVQYLYQMLYDAHDARIKRYGVEAAMTKMHEHMRAYKFDQATQIANRILERFPQLRDHAGNLALDAMKQKIEARKFRYALTDTLQRVKDVQHLLISTNDVRVQSSLFQEELQRLKDAIDQKNIAAAREAAERFLHDFPLIDEVVESLGKRITAGKKDKKGDKLSRQRKASGQKDDYNTLIDIQMLKGMNPEATKQALGEYARSLGIDRRIEEFAALGKEFGLVLAHNGKAQGLRNKFTLQKLLASNVDFARRYRVIQRRVAQEQRQVQAKIVQKKKSVGFSLASRRLSYALGAVLGFFGASGMQEKVIPESHAKADVVDPRPAPESPAPLLPENPLLDVKPEDIIAVSPEQPSSSEQKEKNTQNFCFPVLKGERHLTDALTRALQEQGVPGREVPGRVDAMIRDARKRDLYVDLVFGPDSAKKSEIVVEDGKIVDIIYGSGKKTRRERPFQRYTKFRAEQRNAAQSSGKKKRTRLFERWRKD